MLKKERLLFIILILFVAALGVRYISMLQNEVIANDAIKYIKSAKLYSLGAFAEGFKAFPYSTFPLLIAFAHRFVGDWVRAGQWVCTIFGALAAIPFYFLARRIFSEKIAIVGSIFYIVCPSLVQNSAEVLRDTPFVFFYITALWLGYEGVREKRAGIMGLAGVFILLCASLKDYGLMVFGSILLFLCWFVIKRQVTVGKALILCSTFLASAIVILALSRIVPDYKSFSMQAPIVARAKSAITGITHQRAAMSKLKDEIERSDLSTQAKRLLGLAIHQRFALYFLNIISKTVHAFNIVLFVLFIFGLIKRHIVPYRSDELLLLAIYATYIPLFLLLLSSHAFLQTKNTFPLLVPSLFWSGVGFEEFVGRIKGWMQKYSFPFKEWSLRRTGPLMIILIIIVMLSMALGPHRQDKLRLKETGLWLKNNGYANSIILGQAELMRLAFYADSEFIPIPKGSYEDIIKFARKEKASLLVIDKAMMDRLSPSFLGKVTSEDLLPINVGGAKTPKHPIIVFRILD
jgi:4-amino-4-deoxy-L-arabinose transferase-like glycosyltransferase